MNTKDEQEIIDALKRLDKTVANLVGNIGVIHSNIAQLDVNIKQHDDVLHEICKQTGLEIVVDAPKLN